ncbi:MAG: hypothetical protein D3907_11990 [Candidatus Electrothrix sp. AUS3]|nr:hypothetical protein [Candidatus Electrothrix gigas]
MFGIIAGHQPYRFTFGEEVYIIAIACIVEGVIKGNIADKFGNVYIQFNIESIWSIFRFS